MGFENAAYLLNHIARIARVLQIEIGQHASLGLVTVLQTRMRHADVRTTLKVYAHVIPQSQRDSMERIAKRSIGTFVPIGTGTETQNVEMKEDW